MHYYIAILLLNVNIIHYFTKHLAKNFIFSDDVILKVNAFKHLRKNDVIICVKQNIKHPTE